MKTKVGFRVLSILLALVITFTAAGCTGKNAQVESEKAKDEPLVVKVGYFPNLTHPQALYGLGDGSFQKALGTGVKIEEHVFNAGPAEIEALLAGEVDIGYIGPVPAINGYVKSEGGLKIIAGAADAGAVLVAGKDSGITGVADLKGKKVAIPQLGNTQDISLRNLLNEAGLKDAAKGGTVTVIPAENPDILTLISKGDVDAALVPEPWGSRIVKDAGAKIILDANQVWREGKYTTAVVIVNKKFLDSHSDLVEKWLENHVEITQKINGDKNISKNTLNNQINKLTKKPLPDDVLTSSFERITVTYNPEAESVQEFVRLSLENGYLKGNPDVKGLFELGMLNKVLQKKGLQPLQ